MDPNEKDETNTESFIRKMMGLPDPDLEEKLMKIHEEANSDLENRILMEFWNNANMKTETYWSAMGLVSTLVRSVKKVRKEMMGTPRDARSLIYKALSELFARDAQTIIAIAKTELEYEHGAPPKDMPGNSEE